MIGFMGMEMDKQKFAEIQKVNGWFEATFMRKLPPFDRSKTIKDVIAGCDVPVVDLHRMIFGLTFGAYGMRVDPEAAEAGCLHYLQKMQEAGFSGEASGSNEAYGMYLHEIGNWHIQLGTVYAYMNEPVKAAYHLIYGLKTECVNLFMPYCDFIRCVLAELEDLPKEDIRPFGRGGSVSDPMGCRGGNLLDASIAMNVIPLLAGRGGEMVVAKQGRHFLYGHLVRRGSSHCREQPNCIDIYETWLIDRKYDLKLLRLYFDGYRPMRGAPEIWLPQGFEVPQHVLPLVPWTFRA